MSDPESATAAVALGLIDAGCSGGMVGEGRAEGGELTSKGAWPRMVKGSVGCCGLSLFGANREPLPIMRLDTSGETDGAFAESLVIGLLSTGGGEN